MNGESVLQRVLNTDSSNTALLAQRLTLGLVILPHGAQKLLGWFGGYGFGGTMDFFTGTMGLPWLIAFLVILGESLGALLLMAGLATRIAAFGISAIMGGAALLSHAQHGFFMNWFGAQQGEGVEFFLLALALSLPLMIWGGGKSALDSTFANLLRSHRPAEAAA